MQAHAPQRSPTYLVVSRDGTHAFDRPCRHGPALPTHTHTSTAQDPNFWTKFYGYGAAVYVVALGIPVFAVW